MKFTRIALAASLGLFTGQALAQAEEQLDTTSSFGTSEVRIIKQNAVQITNVDDIDFLVKSALDGDENVRFDAVCVFSSTGLYDVLVESANTADPFALATNDAAIPDTIGYAVTWADTADDTATTDLAAGGVLEDQTGDQSSPTCNDAAGVAGSNAIFKVTLDKADFLDASPATYTDTLTITVSPS